jgi:hypothetical protein
VRRPLIARRVRVDRAAGGAAMGLLWSRGMTIEDPRRPDDDRELVLHAVTEAFNDFVFLDRKLDKNLPWDKLARLVREGVVTKAEIVAQFKEHIDGWIVSE